MTTRWRVLAILLPVALLIPAAEAAAGPIFYTETFTATGSLDSTTFTNALVTLTASGDTSNVQAFTGAYDNLVSLTVSVGAVSDTVTDVIKVEDATGLTQIRFLDAGTNSFTFASAPAFSTYDLRSPIGPIDASLIAHSSAYRATTASGGANGLNITSFTGTTVTFTASTVPEPATLTLLATGLAGLSLRWVGRNRAA